MANYRAMARAAALKYGVNPDIFVAQIQQESGFLPTAYNKRSGATGIAQIMPRYHPSVDAKDPVASLDYAARLMAGYLKQYNGDYATALAAYNSGAGNVEQYGGVPPFAETQNYIKTILGDQNPQGGTPMAGPTPVSDPWGDTEETTPTSDPWTAVADPTPPASNPWGDADANKADWVKVWVAEKNQYWWFDRKTNKYVQPAAPPADAAQAAPRYFPGEGGSQQEYNPVTGETRPIYQPPVDTSKKPYVRNETGEQMPNEDYVPTSTFEDTDGNDRVLRDRLTGRIIARLGPIVAKPGEGIFFRGNTAYKWGADGKPVFLYEFPDESDANSVAWATLAQRKAEFEAKQRADAEAAERAWKQFVEEQERSDARNRLTNTTNFTNDILSTWTKAAPMALLPGQTQFLGANPGGLMDRIAQMGRFTPDEAARNVQPFNIDPETARRWALNATAGGK